jgi:pSer/pThr/pTyr-binding forkhead associated (FHA) protein
LESLDYIKGNKNIKIFYIVKLIDEEITIGRQDYNDIIDNDISISQKYALLRYNKNYGNLFLEDNNSALHF